jgi:hypothetical protein
MRLRFNKVPMFELRRLVRCPDLRSRAIGDDALVTAGLPRTASTATSSTTSATA